MTPRLLRLAAAAAAATMYILAAGHTASTQQPAQQVPGAIRSRITLVPLDVRVLDRAGRPVTDLKEEDFTVFEDGVAQKIGHFAFQQLAAETPGPARPPLRKPLDATVEEQRHRTFLIVLGRGRLQYPARGFDGVIRFVREQLLPQDKVAVAAWNRTTDFTTDHARLVPLLERLRDKHNGLELRLRLRETGLEAVYGDKTLPPGLQAEVDAIFDDERLRPRELAAVRIRDREGFDNEMRRQTEAHMERALGEGDPLADPRLDQFFSAAALGQSTLTTLYSSIEYLKYFDGEKHLVLLNEGGIYLPRAEDDEGLAATASDARVAVHTILTGGVPPAFNAMNRTLDMSNAGFPLATAINGRGPVLSAFNEAMTAAGPTGPHANLFAVGTMRTFAGRSGGFFSTSQMAAKAFDRIDAATRSQYVLGYYPANSSWDGDYRKIDVRVNRRGVTVSVRRGYFATDQLVPFDRRQFLTHSRVASAGEYSRPLEDIRLTMRASISGSEVVVEGTIDPSRLSLTTVDGIRGGEVDLVVFVGDRREEIVGEQWRKIAVKIPEVPSSPAGAAAGIPFSVRVPVKGAPRYVKAIVYDYAADLLGSATVRLR